jgi:hypothetical protein
VLVVALAVGLLALEEALQLLPAVVLLAQQLQG